MKIVNLLLPEEYQESGRCTGQTTAQALRLISEAILNPGVFFPIHDHTGILRAHEHLAYRIKDIIERLDLKYIDVEKHHSEYCVISRHIIVK